MLSVFSVFRDLTKINKFKTLKNKTARFTRHQFTTTPNNIIAD